MAGRDARAVRLFSRNGYNLGDRFPLIVEAIEAPPVRSCLIDGEVIVVDSRGLSIFELLRYRQHDRAAVLCAFDPGVAIAATGRPFVLSGRKWAETWARLRARQIAE